MNIYYTFSQRHQIAIQFKNTLFANASINYPLAGVAICVFASAAHQRAARENYMAEMIFFSALNAPCE
jgi:hypothetical protein